LDENGNFSSVGFSKELQKKMNSGIKTVFVIGGPYGFSDSVYSKAQGKSLSLMTFSSNGALIFYRTVVSIYHITQ
jgi:23S rRNA (pseudouridine1915-N3)-methyltransferase